VRVTGDARAAAQGRALAIEACATDGVELAAASHTLIAAEDPPSGLTVDRVVLGSERGGGPLAPGTTLGAKVDASGARVRVTDEGMTHVDATVRTDGEPFWLVLGQSENEGWELEVDAAAEVGERTLVNGYANGWRITPAEAGELTVRLRWTPQGLVWWAIGISVLAVLCCIAVVVVTWRRRGESGDVTAGADAGSAARGEREPQPELESPLVSSGAGAATLRTTVVAALGTGVVAGLASRPWIGIVVGLATAAALRWPRARAVLTVGSVAAFGVAIVYVIVQQARHGYPTIASWPSRFEDVTDLAWLAVLLLGADVVVQWLRALPSRHG